MIDIKRVTAGEHEAILADPALHPCTCTHIRAGHGEQHHVRKKDDPRPKVTHPCLRCDCKDHVDVTLRVVEHAWEIPERVLTKKGGAEGFELVDDPKDRLSERVEAPEDENGNDVTDQTLQRENRIETKGGGGRGRRRTKPVVNGEPAWHELAMIDREGRRRESEPERATRILQERAIRLENKKTAGRPPKGKEPTMRVQARLEPSKVLNLNRSTGKDSGELLDGMNDLVEMAKSGASAAAIGEVVQSMVAPHLPDGAS
jgi:hypothetical protein